MKKRKRACISLTKKELCFLDRTSKDCKFLEGSKLRRTSIIRALLTAAKGLDIDVSMVRSEEELKQRIVASFRKVA